jgi:hypothetical protein
MENFVEIISFLENDVKSKQIDVIVLTETWHDTVFCHNKIAWCNLFSLLQ